MFKLHYSRITNKNLAPKKIGVYVITHECNDVYNDLHSEKYVGYTKNLCYRMDGHYDKKIIYIDLYVTDDIDTAKSLEKIFINLIKPASNKWIPFLLHKDKTLMTELFENCNIKEYIFENVIKIGCRYSKYININNKIINNNKIILQTIWGTDKNSFMNIPSEFGFKSDEYVELIKINDNSFKVVKVDVTVRDNIELQ